MAFAPASDSWQFTVVRGLKTKFVGQNSSNYYLVEILHGLAFELKSDEPH